jgi:hypothetical protein
MFHETNFIQHFIANWRKVIFNVLIAGSAFGVLCAAHAQYLFDPSNADEQAPGIRYFGSAKDDKGILIPGVTVSGVKPVLFSSRTSRVDSAGICRYPPKARRRMTFRRSVSRLDTSS